MDRCGVFMPLSIFHKDAHTKPTAMQTWHLDICGWIWMHFAHVPVLQLVNVDEAAADAKYQKLCSEVDVLEMVQTGLIRLFLCMHVVSCCF